MEKNNSKQEERSSAAASASGNKSPRAAEAKAKQKIRTEQQFDILKLEIMRMNRGERRTAFEAQQEKIESEEDDSKREKMVEEPRQGIVAARKAEEKRAAAAKAEAETPIELSEAIRLMREELDALIQRINKGKADSEKIITFEEIYKDEEAKGKAKNKIEMKKPVARPEQSKKKTGTASVAQSTRPAARPEQSKNDDIRRKERGKGIAQVLGSKREVKGIVIGEATAKPEAKPKQSLGDPLKIEEKAKSPNKQTFGSLLDKAKKKEEKRSAGRK